MNGLEAAAKNGAPAAVAWYLLSANIAHTLGALRSAITSGNFLAALLFVRDGADTSPIGGPKEVLKAAAQADRHLSASLAFAFRESQVANTVGIFDIFAGITSAPGIVFAVSAQRGDINLCLLLLNHPRVGVLKCALATCPGIVRSQISYHPYFNEL